MLQRRQWQGGEAKKGEALGQAPGAGVERGDAKTPGDGGPPQPRGAAPPAHSPGPYLKQKPPPWGGLAADELEDAPGVRRARVAGEGRAERDHAAHEVGQLLGQLTGVDTTQAPADQAHLAAVALVQFSHLRDAAFQHALARAEVPALLP